MAHVANELKEKGNAFFREGDYAQAEEQYTLAIQKFARNHLLFTNRAFARVRLQRFDGVVSDCLHSIELTGPDQNFKAYFYLAQAQIALNHPNEALSSALTAYEHAMYPQLPAVAPPMSSVTAITALVIQCRKSKFESRQREQQKRRGDLLAELEDTVDAKRRHELFKIEESLRDKELMPVEASERRDEIEQDSSRKIEELKNVFAIADPANHAKRDVPDWAIDTISFELMHDPVVTRNGHSYERSTLVEHLKRSPTDPLTRDFLTVDQLRPNIALRKALDEFWEKAEGWAIDW